MTEQPYVRQVCRRRRMRLWVCGQPAVWHLMFEALETGLACDRHVSDLRREVVDAHPFGPLCCRPGTVWRRGPDGTCIPASEM